MPKNAPFRLEKLLADEVRAAAILLQALADEAVVLRCNDPDAVTTSSQRKLDAAEHLAKLSAQREDWLARQVDDPGPNGLEAVIRRAEPERRPKLGRLRDQLRVSAIRLAHQNQTNGAILEARRLYAQRALDILCGQADVETALYGPTGQTPRGGSSHRLGKA